MTSKPILMLAALLSTGLIAAGCGGDDDGGDGGGSAGTTATAAAPDTGTGESGSADSASVYEDCVDSAQYATQEAIEEACAQIQEDFEDCVASGETSLGTPATPEECRSAALPTS